MANNTIKKMTLKLFTNELLEDTKNIFREYQSDIDTDLCFQDFENELKNLPGKYSEPNGRLYLAYKGDKTVGCIALRPINNNECEMKRLYVRPQFRKEGIGKILVEKIIADAKKIGYKHIVLDTLEKMNSAIRLYKTFGFEDYKPYCFNPEKDAVFMKLDL